MAQGITAQEAQDIKTSHIWELIEREVEYQIEAERNRLEDIDPVDFKETRERLKALRGLLRLPDDAIAREE
jgi:ribosomal protein S12 methylthiotransferase accessory factor YcaO